MLELMDFKVHKVQLALKEIKELLGSKVQWVMLVSKVYKGM
jgi:hypothetical protein